MPEQASHSCPNHIIYGVNLYIYYQNLFLKYREVGNGQFVSEFFIIKIAIDKHGHRSEIFTLVSEIHKNVDLVFGIKNIFELEGIINLQESCFSVLNRSVPFFPKEQIILKPKTEINKDRSTIGR